ncbi:hypothetical protein CHARACLAT_004127, partial [Characodon lateralis]|nr:hypothetical protein [Characodon lateralis]
TRNASQSLSPPLSVFLCFCLFTCLYFSTPSVRSCLTPSLCMSMMRGELKVVDSMFVVSSEVSRHLSEVTQLILYSPCQLPINFYSFVVRPRLFKLSCHNASLSRNKALLYGKL